MATCTNDQLVPRVADLLVSQGAPGYGRLARGKETIVRAYLTTPTTCTLSNKQSIAPLSATVNVSYSTGDPAPFQTTPTCGSPPNPAGTCSNYQPLAGKLGAATQIYSTSDPFFVIPDFYLAPNQANTASFSITFTLNLRYIRNGVTSTTYTATATTGPKTVDQKTNALRVLVVPMGDPTRTDTQWSTAAQTSLQNAMTAAARAFPVPAGISSSLCDTASTTCPLPGSGGIRYVVSTALLDVKSLNLYTNGKFCANGSNWNNTSLVTSGPYAGHALKADLLQRLADYNLRNTPPADIVLGVVDGAIAWRSTDPSTTTGSPSGCDDGRAATPASRAAGQVAWVRVSTDAYPTPLQMELMHPFGISDSSLTFHSPNVEADGGTSKGYNVLQRKVIAAVTGALGTNDHSIMNYNTSISYTNDNTLVEPNDWGDALCDLGGVDSIPGPFTNCTLSTALGTSQGAAASNAVYQISGVLSGSNVRVTDGKVAVGDAAVPIGVADSSDLQLRFYSDCAGTNPLQTFPVARLGGEGHDGLDNHVDQEASDSFGAVVPLPAGAMRVDLLLNGSPISPNPFNPSACDAAPTVTSTSTVATGTVLADFPMPKSNGRAVAFDGNSTLYTTFVGDDRIFKFTTGGVAAGTVSAGVELGALALQPGGHLYGGNYTGTGDIYDIDPGTEPAGRSTVFTYNPDPPPSCPFGEDLQKFIDGLERLPSGNVAISGDRCKRVDIFNPSSSWSFVSSFTFPNDAEDNSGITTDGADGLWLALNQGSATRLAHRKADGTYTDSFSTGTFLEDLAFDDKTFAPNCAVWGMSIIPSPSHLVAYAVPCPSGTTQQAAAVQTQNADFVTLFFTCGSATNLEDEKFPLAVGLRPDAGGEVVAAYTNQLFCGVGSPKILSEASNGWTSTGLSETQAATVSATSKAPRVNIAAPLNGAKFRRGETVHYEGSASDAEQSAITGTGLQWTDDRLTPQNIGSGQSFDLKIPADAPLGEHKITLTATDAQGNTASTFVTISVGPALCPSTSKCP